MSILLNKTDKILVRKIFNISVNNENFLNNSECCLEHFLVDLLCGDQAIKQDSPFEYSTECYRRASEEMKRIRSMEHGTVRFFLQHTVRQSKQFVVRYCRLHLDDISIIAELVLDLVTNEEKCPCGFLEDLFRDFDGAETVFQQIYKDLRDRVSKEPLKDFENSLKALKLISSFPNGKKALVNHKHWIPEERVYVNGRIFEILSILGPFFGISPIPDSSAYGNEEKHKFLDRYVSAARKIQDGLAEIFTSLLKDPEMQEREFEYIAEMINKNYARAQLQPNRQSCSSSGTFMNLSIVMLKLCKPFLDYNYNLSEIDPSYVFSNTRFDFTQLTSLNASPQEFAEMKESYGARKLKYSSITECFFMTSRVLHLGMIKVISEYKKLGTNLQENYYPQTPEEATLCFEAQLMGEITYLKDALAFYRLVVDWLVHVHGRFNDPMTFACLPEHLVDDAMELLLFAFHQVPNAVDGIILDDFIKFIIMFMATPEYIRNPYLRAKMVEVFKLWIETNNSKPLFEGNQVLAVNLAQSCLKLYVDSEAIDSLTDKLKIRDDMAKLLQNLWKVPSHQTAWRETAKRDKGVYLNFLNFLINDSIYLLDRILDAIAERKMLEAEISNEDEWMRKPAQEREEKQQFLDSLKRVFKREFPLAMENIGILETTIQLSTAPFLLPEMVERVANTLNYFLKQLIYRKNYFRGKTELYKKIVGLYIHLEKGDKDSVFSAAISRDGRSYSKELFTKAVNILSKKGADLQMVQEFTKIGVKANAAASEALSVDEALGDIPDEFLDPIEYTLMKDPVILPSTKTAIDRHVILRHLLSNNSDPFNRSYLTKEMLVPDMELKAKIKEFVRSKTQGCGR